VAGVISKDQQPFQGATIALVPDPPIVGKGGLFKSVTTGPRMALCSAKVFLPATTSIRLGKDRARTLTPVRNFSNPTKSLASPSTSRKASSNSVQVDLIPAKDSNRIIGRGCLWMTTRHYNHSWTLLMQDPIEE